MRYWDSSALVSLIVSEYDTTAREAVLKEDEHIATWWCSQVECASALNRLMREGAMDQKGLTTGLANLGSLSASWIEIRPSERVRKRAIRLLRIHPLRAADALQLAAALLASDETPETLPFVCSDERLQEAARAEGFRVL